MHHFVPGWIVALALAVGTVGCRQSAEHGQGHSHSGRDAHAHGEVAGHEHEAKTAQITVWTNGYEVFAEHTAPVVNEPVRFITHVTSLGDFSPRTEGMVRFVFRQGDAAFEHPQAAPERPGIYIPSITFPKTGEWAGALRIPSQGTSAEVPLGTFYVFADAHAAAHAEFAEAPDGVSFLKEQQWKIDFATEPVGRRELVRRVQVPGEVRSKPGFSASITAPLAGRLEVPSLGQALPEPGLVVKEGDALALLQPQFSDAAARFIEIEAEFGRAEAELNQAKAAFERTRKLAEAQAKSERELQEARATLAAAEARHAGAAMLRATYSPKPSGGGNAAPGVRGLELRAPIDGIITTSRAGRGEPVAADELLFTILNPARVWIEARVPESAATRLGKAQDALLHLPGGSEYLSVQAQGGKLVFAGLEVDTATRTVPMIFELPNEQAQLRVGQAVRLHVETARAEGTIAIPNSAIIEEGGQPMAFVQASGETFEKRELTLGIQDGEWVQVLRGIDEGERVVTQGAYPIRLSSISGVIPAHGHAH